MPDKMTREEAIEYGEAEINSLKQTYEKRQQPLVFGESAKALLTLLSTAKKYGDVVGKIEENIRSLKKNRRLEDKYRTGKIAGYELARRLLTEEDK